MSVVEKCVENNPVGFDSCEKCRASKTTNGTETLFLRAVTVWIKKPHVVNRRLCGAKLISVEAFNTNKEMNEFVNGIEKQNWVEESKALSFEDFSMVTHSYTVILRELIPKSQFFPKVYEVVIYDKENQTVVFKPIKDGEVPVEDGCMDTNEISYSISFKSLDDSNSEEPSNEILIQWQCDHEEMEISKRQLCSKWLSSNLLDKLVNWSQVKDISTSIRSLRLVDVDLYQKTYNRLKNEYGRDLVKNWTETTDPQKFVYEDIAIATYLMLIWEEDRKVKGIKHKQTFVDLGCGNGLLVYILTKEGHKGLGIDLRKRRIWDTFGPDIDLKEMTVTPSSKQLFPEYDWLIGNHSDELTPWIPVISARSSYDSNFFVLPCCHHDFVGKFSSSESAKSNYHTYLNYVKKVISNCGFDPESDTLRIPSTKRMCFIGRRRTYEKEQEKEMDDKMQTFINERSGCPDPDPATNPKTQRLDSVDSGFGSSNSYGSKDRTCLFDDDANLSLAVAVGNRNCDALWASEFRPRQPEVKIKNCQLVSTETKRKVVKAVFNLVLSAETEESVCVKGDEMDTAWRKGGLVPLDQVASLFDKEVLQELKSECGGLQTLLRNHSHIFQVTQGKVQLRDFTKPDPWLAHSNPQKKNNKGKNRDKQRQQRRNLFDTLKTTLCWFHDYHPDGCPKVKVDCRYAHGRHDLRQGVKEASVISNYFFLVLVSCVFLFWFYQPKQRSIFTVTGGRCCHSGYV